MNYDVDETIYRRAASMWAFIVQMQGDRLDEAAGEYNTALEDQFWLDRREAGTLSADWLSYVENEVGNGLTWAATWTLDADQYFFLAAAAQLRKCVLALPNKGLPDVPDERMVLLLRNFTEHWEDPAGRAAVELRGHTPTRSQDERPTPRRTSGSRASRRPTLSPGLAKSIALCVPEVPTPGTDCPTRMSVPRESDLSDPRPRA